MAIRFHVFSAVGTARIMAASAALAAVCLSLAFGGRANAQSLNLKDPAPLQEGANDGTVDNFVGPNYFYFWAGPGKTTVTVSYKSMSLLGAAQRSALTVAIASSNAEHTILKRTTISSLKESSQQVLTLDLKKEARLILAVLPPSGGLIRSGGDYEVSASGAVRFGKPLSDTELIVGTYTPKVIMSNEDTAMKFSPDGTLEFASGTTGTWKLFDASSHLYTISFANNRLSLKLIPGRGLVNASDPTSLVFQRNR